MQAIWDNPHQMLTLLVLVLTLLVIILSALMIFTGNGRRTSKRRSVASLRAQDLAGDESAIQRIESLSTALREAEARLGRLEQALLGTVSHVGLVRFNAFRDTGSDLSFSLALLDGKHNGVVLTSLYGRDEGRVYAKPISGGTSVHPLSNEEKRAIAEAGGGGGR